MFKKKKIIMLKTIVFPNNIRIFAEISKTKSL